MQKTSGEQIQGTLSSDNKSCRFLGDSLHFHGNGDHIIIAKPAAEMRNSVLVPTYREPFFQQSHELHSLHAIQSQGTQRRILLFSPILRNVRKDRKKQL